MANNRRTERLNSTLRKEIANVIIKDVKDPRLLSMVTVLETSISPDRKLVKVKVSIFGNSELNNLKTFEALQAASGFISSLVSKGLKMRFAPEIRFERSDVLEKGAAIYKKIKDLHLDEEGKDDSNETTNS